MIMSGWTCSGSHVPTRLEPRSSAVPRSLSMPWTAKAEAIATRMDLCGNTVRHWLNRFNARGLDGLEEDVRTGRPPTYSAEQRSTVITAALTRPSELGLPFASWTLDRLVSYLSEQGIAMRRSRISEIFIREGLRWRQDETWFGARVDPDFAKKRGRSNSSTRRRRQAA